VSLNSIVETRCHMSQHRPWPFIIAVLVVLVCPHAGVRAVEKLELVKEISQRTWVTGIAFSPDGKLLAIGTGGTSSAPERTSLTVFDTQTWEPRFKRLKFWVSVGSPVFSSDSKRLAFSASAGQVVDTATGKVVVTLTGPDGHSREPDWIRFADGDRLLVTSGHGSRWVEIWNSETGKLLRTENVGAGDYESTAAHPKAPGVALLDSRGDVYLFYPATSKSDVILRSRYKYAAMRLSPDGASVFVDGYRDEDHGIKQKGLIYNVASRQTTELECYDVSGGAFSPDSTRLALCASWSAREDVDCRVFDVASGKKVTEYALHLDPGTPRTLFVGASNVAYSPDGRLLASKRKGIVRIWRLPDGK
jgi:WD40 repeat protein